MEKRYIIYNMVNNQYYTGMYYDIKEAWDRDYEVAELFKSIDEIDNIINDEDEGDPKMVEFFKEYTYLEIKIIFLKL